VHRSRLGGLSIDCRVGDLSAPGAFWSRALGLAVTKQPASDGLGAYVALGRAAGVLHVEVQRVDHDPRVHLDIETDDVDAEVARLEDLGARRFASVRDWWVMEAPTGQRFCVVRVQNPDFGATATAWPGRQPEAATHRSRLGGLIVDCRVDDIDGAGAFWSTALGLAVRQPPSAADPNYASLDHAAGGLHVEVQRVDHDPRVHLDIETDDVDAEVRRLESLGALRVRPVHDWWVMQAPTGQRFCIVPAQNPEFAATARVWA
jgi:predicted enzyme related to lactoylglutathione lyase